MMPSENGAGTGFSAVRRRSTRLVTAALSGIVGALYLTLLVLVARAEAVPGATDSNTYGAYLFMGVIYVLGAGLLAVVDRPIVLAVGAVVQVFVLALFVLFGVGAFGPGAFEYEAVSGLGMLWWAAVITSAQVTLFGLLCYLLSPSSRRSHA